MSAVVQTVTAASALQWVRGEIDDHQLVPGHDVIHFHELPGRNDYRAGLREVLKLHRAGARFCIARACHPVVAGHIARLGGFAAFVEQRSYQGQTVLAKRCLFHGAPNKLKSV